MCSCVDSCIQFFCIRGFLAPSFGAGGSSGGFVVVTKLAGQLGCISMATTHRNVCTIDAQTPPIRTSEHQISALTHACGLRFVLVVAKAKLSLLPSLSSSYRFQSHNLYEKNEHMLLTALFFGQAVTPETDACASCSLELGRCFSFIIAGFFPC